MKFFMIICILFYLVASFGFFTTSIELVGIAFIGIIFCNSGIIFMLVRHVQEIQKRCLPTMGHAGLKPPNLSVPRDY